MDLFVLADPQHTDTLRTTIDTARRYLSPTPGRIVVVAQNGEAGFLDGRGVLGFAPADLPVVKTVPAERRPGFFRQLLRWGLAAVAQDPTYMVMDSGTVLHAPCPVLDGQRYLLRRENWLHFPDWRMHNWLFGMYPQPGGWFVTPAMVYDRSIVSGMLALIQQRYGNVRWYDAVLNILSRVPQTHFQAAQAYGGYLENFHRAKISTQPTNGEITYFDADVPAVVETAEKPRLRMSTLGVNGRFGNQIFQYAFLRLFAQEHGMEAQNPHWVGASLFGHQDRWSTDALPLWQEKNGVLPAEMTEQQLQPSSHELWGYFQLHTSYYRARQAEFRKLFRPADAIRTPLDQAIARLRGEGKTLIGIHLRRGDYTGGDFWPAPAEWYVRWLLQIWPTVKNPVLYVASDEPGKVINDFAQFIPKTAADLGITLNGAEFYADFYMLTQCDVLAISNSTFSYAAAMLNEKAVATVRPDPAVQGLISFDPWDNQVLLTAKQAA